MHFSRIAALLLGLGLALAGALVPGAVFAASSATMVFDFVSDPGDVGDGPDFIVTGSGLVDDGSGCDSAVAVMMDATGTVTDVDSFCLSLATGTGGSDGDYGSFGTGYLPTAGPVTYAIFDLTAADIAALTLLAVGDNDPAYVAYVLANCTFLIEDHVDVVGLLNGPPYSLSPNFQCYQGKDLKNPKFTPPQDVAVVDPFATSSVDVKKPFLVCAPSGSGKMHLCCYKMKGPKLAVPANVETDDSFGTLQLRLTAPKLLCTACAAKVLP